VKNRLFLILFIFSSLVSIFAQKKLLTLGESNQWEGVKFYNVMKNLGKKGYEKLEIKNKEYSYDSSTDLLLHFNQKNETIPESYKIISKYSIDKRIYSLGGGSATFSETEKPVILIPQKGSIFEPGAKIEDFSLEFRIMPADLSRRENLFYWKNVRIVEERLSHQFISCAIKNRIVQWDFINFFTPPNKSDLTISIKSRKRLIPGRWSHHLISYESKTGRLSYKIDGILEAITFVTVSQNQYDCQYNAIIGDNPEGLIHLGKVFHGKMDEFRISKKVITNPLLKTFSEERGVVLTDPIDFKYTNTQLMAIESKRTESSSSNIYYYYRLSNNRSKKVLWSDDKPENYKIGSINEEWIPFSPGNIIKNGPKGRFLQILVELYPDGKKEISPILKNIRISYLEDLPPIPPAGLFATPFNGKVLLRWNPVTDSDLGGYILYFGTESGIYLGDKNSNKSPIDVGNVTSYTVDRLENGKLYFFAIVSYDSSYMPHKSNFSNEVSARPSRIYGAGE